MVAHAWAQGPEPGMLPEAAFRDFSHQAGHYSKQARKKFRGDHQERFAQETGLGTSDGGSSETKLEISEGMRFPNSGYRGAG